MLTGNYTGALSDNGSGATKTISGNTGVTTTTTAGDMNIPSGSTYKINGATVLGGGFNGAYAGTMGNNTSFTPTALDQYLFLNNVFQINQNGTLYSAAIGPTGTQINFSGTLTDSKLCTYGTGGIISCNTTPAGGGNVSNSGTPTIHQWPVWTTTTAIKGVSVTASKPVCTDSNAEPIACTNLTDVAIPTGTFAGQSYGSTAVGDILIGGAAGVPTGKVADVATGQVLTSGGTGAAPVYSANPSVTSVTTVSADAETSITSTTTGTGNINLDGVSASDYNYSNGSSTATYTPVFTSLPSSGYVRYITATFGGGSGVDTMTWTNVNWIGTTGAAATTTNKKSTYACILRSSGAWCKIVQEAY